ncbi:hypothetical protein H0H93_014971, partial [Arthromyces matolae]
HSTDSEVKDEKKKLRPRSTQQAPQQQRQPPKSASWPKRSGSGDRKFDYQACARPDCDESEKRPDEYFMTAILGRYTKVVGGSGRKYMWLVKWDG